MSSTNGALPHGPLLQPPAPGDPAAGEKQQAATPTRMALPAPADIFDEAPCALLLTDPDGTILHANRTSVTWLGYPRQELTGGMRLQDLLSIGGGVLYQSHCQPLLRLQKAVGDVQIDLVRRDGARVPALLNVARRRFDGGERDAGELAAGECAAGEYDVLAIFAAADRRAFERELQRTRAELLAAQAARDDMTGRLRMAIDELNAADRRRDAFLLAFCHDLRNPLAPMRSGLDLLKLTLPSGHAAARLVTMLERQLRELVHLIDGAQHADQVHEEKPGNAAGKDGKNRADDGTDGGPRG